MSKKSEKATAVEPLRAKAVLSGPGFRMGPGLPRCSLKIPGEILAAAGLGPNVPVELIAVEDSIVIKRAGDRRPPLPNPSPRNDAMNALMKLSVEPRPVDPRRELEESSDDERRDLFARVN